MEACQQTEPGRVSDPFRHGGDTIWYENGGIQFTVQLKEDKKIGPLQKWSPEGKVIFEAIYANDSLVEITLEQIDRSKLK